MARQTHHELKPLSDSAAHHMGRSYWYPKKPNKRIKFRDMDLGWLQNVIRWLERKRGEYIAESNAAAGYGGSGDEACSAADFAADHFARKAATATEDIHAIKCYVLWREENGYIFHAPKPTPKRVPAGQSEGARPDTDG